MSWVGRPAGDGRDLEEADLDELALGQVLVPGVLDGLEAEGHRVDDLVADECRHVPAGSRVGQLRRGEQAAIILGARVRFERVEPSTMSVLWFWNILMARFSRIVLSNAPGWIRSRNPPRSSDQELNTAA
jgi:hypothetical protein